MKRFLSVICMAILAGGLIFTSCDKKFTITVNANNDAWGSVTGGGEYADQATAVLTAVPNNGYEFVKWQDGNTENPRTITVTADETYTAYFKESTGTKVTFNGGSWKAANALGVDYTSDDYIIFYFFRTASSTEDVYCQGYLEDYPGTFDYEGTGGDIMNYRDPNFTWTDEDGVLGNAGTTYWGWYSMPETFAEVITAVDLNALSISGTWSADVATVEGYATTGQFTPVAQLNGVMNNANWDWTSKKAGDERTKATIQKVR